ncbi:hypothetical protein D3C73_1273050 [compost metagenome]
MRTGDSCFFDMGDAADAGGDNFGSQAVVGQDRLQILDQLHAVYTDIIQTSDERADISSASLGSHEALGGGEDQCNVGFDAAFGQLVAGSQSIFSHWQLDHYVRCPLGDFQGFRQHFFGGQANNFGTYRAWYNFNDFFDYIFEQSAFFGNQRRVRRYAIH